MAMNGRGNNYGMMYPAGYGYQAPGYWPQYQQPMMEPQAQNIRTVEIEPAESVKAASEAPVAAGLTKMFIGRDDSFILVKAVSMTGQVTIDIYDKRPPEPPAPVINPADYVRRDEIQTIIAEAIGSQKRTPAKKEAASE